MGNVYVNIVFLIAYLSANLITVTKANKKTILLWYLRGSTKTWPFDQIGPSNSFFVKYKCKYQNCYVSSNQKKKQREKADSFDAVLFSGGDSAHMTNQDLPGKRSHKQFYVFITLDAADSKPVCQKHFDHFYNWTMTYRLDSNIPWTHFQIKQFDNKTVGPRKRVDWIHPREMIDIEQRTQAKLNRKVKLAAWFVSDCRSKGGGKEKYVKSLSESLIRLAGQTVDIFGACGNQVCSDLDLHRSNRMLDHDYLFYLAFESFHDQDYVTDKLLTAFENYNVPIVLGGADYNRFAPPGSYLNAGKYSPYKLAGVMAFLNKRREKLYDFHKWRNYYYFVDNYDMLSGLCNLCAKLNEDTTPRTHKRFRQWWNPEYARKCQRRRPKPKIQPKTATTEISKALTEKKSAKGQSMFLKIVSMVSRPIGYLLSTIV